MTQQKFNIPICVPNISGNEGINLSECVESTYVSSVGKFVDELENELEKVTRFKHACAVSSGTSALSLALHNLGVEHGDLVIIPDYTFIATANAVQHCGASPWLIDIDPKNLNLDLDLVRQVINKNCSKKGETWRHNKTNQKLSAIIPVFSMGNAIEFSELNKLFEDYQIPVIVDGAGALGLTTKEGELGRLNVSCITTSFNGNKTFTCGGGGAILSNNTDFHDLCKHTSTTARTGDEYIHDLVGFNHRMTNLQAAVGCAQLERYEEFVRKKLSIFDFYESNLRFPEFIGFQKNIESSRWLSYFLLKENVGFCLDELFVFAKENGIFLGNFWVPMHLQPPYQKCIKEKLIFSRSIYKRICVLPSSTGISNDEIYHVCEVLNKFFKKKLHHA